MRALSDFRLRRPYLTQALLVAFLTAAFVLGTEAIKFRSAANILWMAGVPLSIALMMNRGWDRRAFMLMALLAVAAAVLIFVGVNFTSYG